MENNHSNAAVISVCRSEERAEPEGEVFNLPVNLCSYTLTYGHEL